MNGTFSPATGSSAPTRVRYGVLGFAAVLAMITYLDRACIGQVGGFMQKDFGLDDDQVGWVKGAFILAYSLFEIPSGWLGDVYGPRRTLLRIVLWWSFFTVLLGLVYPTPAVPRLAMFILIGVNFLFGAGEAGAFPNIGRAFHNWFPMSERGFAQGFLWMAGRFAGGMAPFVVLALLYQTPASDGTQVVHWRHIFWIFGSLGVVWCVAFWTWFRDRPDQHPDVNAAERAYILGQSEQSATTNVTRISSAPNASHADIPWRRILTNGNLWLLSMMYFLMSYGWYFILYQLPDAVRKHYSIETYSFWQKSLLLGAPMLAGSTACLLGGLLTDLFIRRTGDRKWGRRLFGMVGHVLCALFYLAALLIWRGQLSPWLLVTAITLVSLCNDITMGATWASCLDIGRRYSGIVAGCMNSIGNLGGLTAVICAGYLLKAWGPDLGYQICFISYSCAYLISVVLWTIFDPTKPVVPEEH